MKAITILSAALISVSAFATEADKDVGTCMAYFVKTNRSQQSLQTVMNLAANQAVAMQYAKIGMRKPADPWEEGDACRRVGISPSKYR